MARRARTSAAKRTAGIKVRITAKQKAARKINIEVARRHRKKKAGGAKKKDLRLTTPASKRMAKDAAKAAVKKKPPMKTGWQPLKKMTGASGKTKHVDVLVKNKKGDYDAYVGAKKVASSSGLRVTRYYKKTGPITVRERNTHIRKFI